MAAVALYCRGRARLPVLQEKNKIQQFVWTDYTQTYTLSASRDYVYTLICTYRIATLVPV